MTTSVVVSSIFLSIDKLFRMIQLPICSTSGLINHSRFEVHKDSTGHMFTAASFREEGLKGVISTVLSMESSLMVTCPLTRP